MSKKRRLTDSRRSDQRRSSTPRLCLFPLEPRVESLEIRRLLSNAINEFGGSATLANPAGIVAGPDENLWFTEASTTNPAIGRITPSGAIEQFSTASFTNSKPTGITLGDDDALWFTDPGANAIGRIDTQGDLTKFPLPVAGSEPDQIVLGSDGNLWFTEPGINAIGQITTAGVVTNFSNGLSLASDPTGITAGPNGALWFTESATSKIGEITTTGTITEFSTGITPGSDPVGIVEDFADNLWFTENQANQIGRITSSGVVTEFSANITAGSGPLSITVARDGNLYFTQQNSNTIGKITPEGDVTEIPGLGATTASPDGITEGPDKNLWYTENVGNHVDRLGLFSDILTQFPSPTNALSTGSSPNGITAGPDDALWFTELDTGKIGRIDTSANLSEYSVGGFPQEITLGPVPQGGGEADLWYTDDNPTLGDIIGEISSSGTIVGQFATPTQNSTPEGITLGPDGNLWFTESGDGLADGSAAIGMITPSGTITEFRDGLTSSDVPNQIATGSDGALWFTGTTTTGGFIGRFVPPSASDPDPAITEYPIPNNSALGYQSTPEGIVTGFNNDLWFADSGNHAIGRITTAGVITEFTQGFTAADVPADITQGPDGNYWFSDPSDAADPVGKITPQGVVTLLGTPTPLSAAEGIAAGPDKNIWFTESQANQIGQVVLPTSITQTAISQTLYATIDSDFAVANLTDLSAATNATNFEGTIESGDGTSGGLDTFPSDDPTQFFVDSIHDYGTVGVFPATISVGNAAGTLPTLSTPINVISPITLSGIAIDGTAGTRANTLVANFSDVDTTATAGDFTATILWGDGSTTSLGTLIAQPSSIVDFNIYGGHTYATAGSFNGSIMLVDNRNGLTATTTFVATVASAPTQTIFNEFGPSALTPGALPNKITDGPDGALWFTESGNGDIGRIDTSGNVTQYAPISNDLLEAFGTTTGSTTGPDAITDGPDGNLWFTDPSTNEIGRITTQGVISLFSNGIASGSEPTGISAGPDGALWFTEQAGNAIGRITTAGVVTEFSAGMLANDDPDAIVEGPDGNLWFVGTGSNEIGRITPQGVITFYSGATGSNLSSIVEGPDDALWFTEESTNQIGKINPTTFAVSEYTGTAIVGPSTITKGPDGDLWFTESGSNAIGRITTQGVSTQFSTGLTLASSPEGIATGPDGNLYFTEMTGDRIGQVVLPRTSVEEITAPALTQILGQTFDGNVATFQENSPLVTSANLQAQVSWGDGTTSDIIIPTGGDGQFSIPGNHQYTKSGNYTGTVTVENATGSQSVDFQVSVEQAIRVQGINVSTQAGRSFTAPVASFSDLNGTLPAGSYLLTIDWGDGTTSTGTQGVSTTGQLEVIGTHTYATTGNFTITTTVSVINAPYETAQGTSSALVTPFVSAITAQPVSFSEVQNIPFSALLASFANTSQSGSTIPASGYSALINWGDGTPTVSGIIDEGVSGFFSVSGSHTYRKNGQFPVTVFITLIDQPDSATVLAQATVLPSENTESFVVTNTNDSGLGSLRQAILNANQSGGHGITFAIPASPGTVETIAPESPLPAIQYTTFIDGTTQATFEGSSSATPLIQVDGKNLGTGTPGLVFNEASYNSELVDLSVFGFLGPQVVLDSQGDKIYGDDLGLSADGAETTLSGTALPNTLGSDGLLVEASEETIGGLSNGQGNVISGNLGQGIEFVGPAAIDSVVQGNKIGTDPSGTIALPNRFNGITADNGAGSLIIGPSNLISGNAYIGVALLGSSNNLIFGNTIGLNAGGSEALGNANAGVDIDFGSTNNTIGGTGSASNVISGNGAVGITIEGGSSGNFVVGNKVGTDPSGSFAIGNGVAGILISNASENFVGEGNEISGNGSGSQGAGVWIEGPTATGNVVQGNLIGTDATGEHAIGNNIIGVLINDAPFNTIGGDLPAQANLISGNSEIGVMISGDGSIGNLVAGNLIGTDALGTHSIANGTGVYIDNAPANFIGGSTAGFGNVISGNSVDGVQVFGPDSSGNLFQGNKIGTDDTGTLALGNSGNGVLVNGSPGTRIIANLIDSNRENGVFVSGSAATGTVLQRNSIGVTDSGRPLGNDDFGLLISNQAIVPVQLANRNLNNTLGPIRNTNIAPATPSTKSSATKKTSVKLQAKSISFGDRAMSSLAGRGRVRSKRTTRN